MRHLLRFLGTLAVLVSALGVGQSVEQPAGSTATFSATPADSRSGRAVVPPPQALVTSEDQNCLLVVDLPSGRLVRRVSLPADPEDLASHGDGAEIVVVSSRAGEVTVLERGTLRRIKTLGGFDEPHIVEVSPDGQFAYVTDDVRGTLTAIRMTDPALTSTIFVGLGAHHMTFSPDQQRLWVALGESASRISILDTANMGHPRVIGHLNPGFLAHDLMFSRDSRQVWITSASGPDVTVFDARSDRVLFRVPVGAPPQHLAMDGDYAYITSGYGSTIEKVNAATGRVVTRVAAPYGSFELAASDGFVVTSSLLRGTLAIYNTDLRLLRVVRLAPADREVVISRP